MNQAPVPATEKPSRRRISIGDEFVDSWGHLVVVVDIVPERIEGILQNTAMVAIPETNGFKTAMAPMIEGYLEEGSWKEART